MLLVVTDCVFLGHLLLVGLESVVEKGKSGVDSILLVYVLITYAQSKLWQDGFPK